MENKLNEKHAARVSHPGEILLEELNARNLTQSEFSAIIDRPARTVNEIIKGKRGITPETAEVIAAALGTSPDIWLGMQSEYDLYLLNKKTQNKTEDVRKRSELYGLFPIADLIRRGYIKSRKSVLDLESDVLSLLGTPSLDVFKKEQVALYRTSEGDIVQSYLKSWVLLGKKKATELNNIGQYNKDGLVAFTNKIKDFSRQEDGIKSIVNELNKLGVRVIVLAHFSKTRVDGAACWIDESPVIILSLRYDRIDNFYFTLLHEIGHIVLHDANKIFVDTDIFKHSDNTQEKQANEFATCKLGLLSIFKELQHCDLNPSLLKRKSDELNIHPGLLIGHLQHVRLLDYSAYRKVLVKVVSLIPAEVMQK